MDTRTTRLPVDLLDAASEEARRQHRSTAKQVEHWARVGMYFDRQTSVARRRIMRAVAGEPRLGECARDDDVATNEWLDASIPTVANATSFADQLAARGVTTIVMDEAGRMVRRDPDGSTKVL